jgi:hypothetical protein
MPAPDVRAMLVHVVKAANRQRRASLSSSGRAQNRGPPELKMRLKAKVGEISDHMCDFAVENGSSCLCHGVGTLLTRGMGGRSLSLHSLI